MLYDSLRSNTGVATLGVPSTRGSSDSTSKAVVLSCLTDVALRTAYNHQVNQSALSSDGVQCLTVFYRIIFGIMESLSCAVTADGIEHRQNKASAAVLAGTIDWVAVDEAIANHCLGRIENAEVSRFEQHSSVLNRLQSTVAIEHHALLDLDLEAAALNFDRGASLRFLLKCVDQESQNVHSTRRGPSKVPLNIDFLHAKAHRIRNKYIYDRATSQISRGKSNRQQHLSVSEQAFFELLSCLEDI